MTPSLDHAVQLAALIEKVSGIVVPERDTERLHRTAAERAADLGLADVESYLRYLRRDDASAEWRKLLGQITVKESYLFRAPQQFAAIAEVALPQLCARQEPRRLRVWSAGCARGEEAATLAIVLAEAPQLAGWTWSVLGTDVDEAALEEARAGLYGARAVSRVPPSLLERYFTRRGDAYHLDKAVASHITYQSLNLIALPFELERLGFDLIFLRNVLIYFRQNSQRRVLRAMAEALDPAGFLFVGPSESIWQLCPDLKPLDLGTCFCYRRSDAEALAGQPPVSVPTPTASLSERPEPMPGGTVQTGRAEPPKTAPSLPPDSQPDGVPELRLGSIVESLEQGRSQEALDRLAHETRRYPDDPTLRAFEGLAHDLSGRLAEAIRSYRAALYLEPRLFQIHYLLASCMERQGCARRARHAYREALAVLSSGSARALAEADRLGLPSEPRAEALSRSALERGLGQ